MNTTVSQIKEEWADREAIRECLCRYARGIDRIDEGMLRSAYWPDATDDHGGLFLGTADEFIDKSLANLASLDQTVHNITNVIIKLDGDKAAVESYVYAIQRQEIDGVMSDIVASARYLDRFERRGDEWRIAQRRVIIDWFRNYPDSADWTVGPFGMPDAPRGTKRPDDASYTWLGF